MRIVALLAVVVSAVSARADDFFFQPKDRVVFLGDSITEQYQYSTYMELYLTLNQPKAEMLFLNAGISGDTAEGGAGRFNYHVLSDKPTKVTINFGMNDAGYRKFDANLQKRFLTKTEEMLVAAKKAGVKVALVSPNAVDRRITPERNNFALYVETQKEFYAPLKDLATKHGFPFADQYAKTRAAVENMEKDDPKAAKAKPYYDGFHTASPGGMLMAHAILTGLKAPSLVSEVKIDAAGKTVEAKRVNVTDLVVTPSKVTFTRLDEALPLPIQKDWLPMLPYMDQLNDLNRYTLAVSGLEDGKYAVKVDGIEITELDAKELQAGTNLGNLTRGPIWEQANKVFQKINAKNDVVHDRFRKVTMYDVPNWIGEDGAARKEAERAKRLQQIETLQAEVYKLAQPVARKFEIVKK
ncbi:MAG: SGNH/GDSL hydrolase family protein [Fimbriiglobus sp.]